MKEPSSPSDLPPISPIIEKNPLENINPSTNKQPSAQAIAEERSMTFLKLEQALQYIDGYIDNGKDHYTGKEIETIFFGNRSDGTYTQESKKELLRDVKAGRIQQSRVTQYHNDEKARVDRSEALSLAIKKYVSISGESVPPERRVYADQGVLLHMLNAALKTRSSEQSKLSAITTIDTPMDVDYGTDALVYSASTDSERKDTIYGKRPFISLGITTKEKTVGTIRSNIEIYMPNSKDFIRGFLKNPQEFIPIVNAVSVATQRIFDEKMSGTWKDTPFIIDCADLVEQQRNGASLH